MRVRWLGVEACSIQEQHLRRNVKRCRGGLVFKAHRLLYHSIIGLRVKRRREESGSSHANYPRSSGAFRSRPGTRNRRDAEQLRAMVVEHDWTLRDQVPPSVDSQMSKPSIDSQTLKPSVDGQTSKPRVDSQTLTPSVDIQTSKDSSRPGLSLPPQLQTPDPKP